MKYINVWFYNNDTQEWIQKKTNHIIETKDEHNYFRCISNSEKHFYSSFEDYLKHNEQILNLNDNKDIYDINNNKLK